MCAKYNPLLSTKAFMARNLWSIHRVPLDLEGLTFLFSKLYSSFRIRANSSVLSVAFQSSDKCSINPSMQFPHPPCRFELRPL